MRTINNSLAAVQGALDRKVYIEVVFTSNDEERTFDASDRILSIEHHEYQDSGYANIILDNKDRQIPDLRGYHVEIAYGDVIDGAGQSQATPRIWVLRQKTVSKPGYLYTQLYLEDGWEDLGAIQALISGNEGLPDYLKVYNKGTTIYDIIADILSSLGYFSEYTLLPVVASDGLLDVFQPYFEVRGTTEYRREAIKRLIMMTKSYLRMKPNLEIEPVFPQESDPVEVSYYSDHAPYFHELEHGENECMPNTVFVYCNAAVDEGGQLVYDENGNLDWSGFILGTAQDEASAGRIGIKPITYLSPLIQSQGDADNRAAAILSRVQSSTFAARLLVPHDCRIELYDKIEAGDGR